MLRLRAQHRAYGNPAPQSQGYRVGARPAASHFFSSPASQLPQSRPVLAHETGIAERIFLCEASKADAPNAADGLPVPQCRASPEDVATQRVGIPIVTAVVPVESGSCRLYV